MIGWGLGSNLALEYTIGNRESDIKLMLMDLHIEFDEHRQKYERYLASCDEKVTIVWGLKDPFIGVERIGSFIESIVTNDNVKTLRVNSGHAHFFRHMADHGLSLIHI